MRLTTLTWLLVAAFGSGCTSVRESFPGKTPEQVWTALVAVAETPDYDDPDDVTNRWHVRENDAVVFEDDARIEVFRRVQRVLHRESARPLSQDRTWRFQITLTATEPPQARFVSRGPAIPTHAADEATRYFNDVWNLLGGRPEDQPVVEEPAMVAEPAPVDEDPAIDIDDLEPN